MNYLLDNNKVYCIFGFVIFIWLYCMFSSSKNTPKIYTLTPFKTQSISGFEPRYFNNEIYTLPNAKASPNMLYGSNVPQSKPVTIGFERLLPQVEQLPKLQTITAYSFNYSTNDN
jgi:hypothetical protein